MLLWALPVGFLAGWYVLSANDWSLGIFFLSRETHDLVFQIYGDVLGIAPETIPPLVMKAIVVDTFIVLGFVALRRRRAIAAFAHARFGPSAGLRRQDREAVERPL